MTKAEIIAELERLIKDDYDEFERIRKGSKGKLWAKYAVEMSFSHNKYGVPYRTFCFKLGKKYGDDECLPSNTFTMQGGLFGGKLVADVNIGEEEHWGDIQSHFKDGNHNVHLCYGSELGGYYVNAVYEYGTGKLIKGRLNLLKWAKENVWKWVDWYTN